MSWFISNRISAAKSETPQVWAAGRASRGTSSPTVRERQRANHVMMLDMNTCSELHFWNYTEVIVTPSP
jgi:hypothetical protein